MKQIKSIILAALLSNITLTSIAQEVVDNETNPWEACAPLSISPQVAEKMLNSFEDLFGKSGLDWTDKDFKQVKELATACHGVSFADGYPIDANQWIASMENARANILPINLVYSQIVERSRYLILQKARLPKCHELVNYTKKEENKFGDNSKEIFGTPLWGLENTDLQSIVDHTNNCLAFIPQYGGKVYNIDAIDSKRILEKLMDEALIAKEYNTRWNSWTRKKETDLLIEVDGVRVTPVYTIGEVQDLIRRFNDMNSSRNHNAQSARVILTTAEGILKAKNNLKEIDVLYIEAVKEAVTSGIVSKIGL